MAHLTEEELVDVAEGTRPESAEPHLASCDECRAQVAELHAVMSVAADAEVPEPSPLFWDHFSARVRDAVANETAGAGGSPAPGWASRVRGWRVLVPAAALAALVLAAAMVLRSPSEPGSGDPSRAADASSGAVDSSVDVAALVDDDPSLSLLADLAGELDLEDAVQAGLTTESGSVDRVVFEMSAGERQELQRILREELALPQKLKVKS